MEELSTQVITLLKGIWKYRWWSALLSWVIFVAGATIVFLLPNNYEASARVYVDTQSVLKPLLSGMTSVPNVEQQVQIMSRTLLSRPNLERLLKMVDLDITAKTDKDREQLILDLTRNIKLSGTGREDIYTITYAHQNPRLARDVVQSLLTIFVEGSFGDKRQDSQKAVAFIDEQIRAYEQKLVGRREAAKLSEELTAAGMVKFRIVEPPIVPQKPIGPNRLRLLSIVIAAAIAGGLGLGFLMSQMRPTFISLASLRALTDVPLLGTISIDLSPAQRVRQRRSGYALGLVYLSLVLAYAAAAVKAL